jgi:hypothetical protein
LFLTATSHTLLLTTTRHTLLLTATRHTLLLTAETRSLNNVGINNFFGIISRLYQISIFELWTRKTATLPPNLAEEVCGFLQRFEGNTALIFSDRSVEIFFAIRT